MAVSVGDIITASHYNSLASNIHEFWGDHYAANTPSDPKSENNRGWGQTNINIVSAGDIITAEEYNHFVNILNLAQIQTSASTATAKVAVGDTITAAQFNDVESKATTFLNNRINSTNATTTSGGADNSSSRGAWSNSVSVTCTATFNNYREARYFFNTGGQLRFSFSNDGSSNDAAAWQDLFDSSDMGTLIFSYNDVSQTGSRTGNITSGSGFYELTTTPTLWYSINLDISPYTTSKLEARFSRNSSGDTITTDFTLTNNTGVVDGSTYIYEDHKKANDNSATGPTVNFSITGPTQTIGSWTGS